MYKLIRKLHMYVGLVNFSALVVFGIAGLCATFGGPPESPHSESRVSYQDFVAAKNLSDKELADQVHSHLAIPLTTRVPTWALRRNQQNQLALDFYTVNGIHRVTVVESENRLRIERVHNAFAHFARNLHTVTISRDMRDPRMILWGIYNELAIFSLIALTLSGVYLWLASRPGFRWAQLSLVTGSGLFVALYAVTR